MAEVTKVRGREISEDGRPRIFARRTSATRGWGKAFFEAAVDAFMELVEPAFEGHGKRTKMEADWWSLQCLLAYALMIFGPVPEATYWAYTRAFCKDTSEEDLPKRAKKAARKFVKAEQAMMNGED